MGWPMGSLLVAVPLSLSSQNLLSEAQEDRLAHGALTGASPPPGVRTASTDPMRALGQAQVKCLFSPLSSGLPVSVGTLPLGKRLAWAPREWWRETGHTHPQTAQCSGHCLSFPPCCTKPVTPQCLLATQGCWFMCRRGRESACSFADLTRPGALLPHCAPRRRSGQSPCGPHRVLRVCTGCPHWTAHVHSGWLVSRVRRAILRGNELPHVHSPTVPC